MRFVLSFAVSPARLRLDLPRAGRVGFAALALTFLGAPGAALADPIPHPKIDYAAKGTLLGRGTFSVRHHAGTLRMDMAVPGTPGAIAGLINLGNRKVLMQMPGTKMAMEIAFGDDASFGQVAGDGKMTGTATVAGERCNLWEVAATKGDPVVACITADGIGLRTETVVEGKRQTVMEVTEFTRAPQEAALFSLPPDTQIIRAPGELRALFGGAGAPKR